MALYISNGVRWRWWLEQPAAGDLHGVGNRVGFVGSGLALTNNGGSKIGVAGNGVVMIANGVSANTAYQVAVASQPTGPSRRRAVLRTAAAL